MALTRSEKIAIICAVAPPLLTVLIDWFKGKPILTTLFSWLASVFKWSWTALSFKVPVWSVLLIFVLISLLVIRWLIKVAKRPAPFNFLSYKEDNFDGFRWTWNYEFKSQETRPHIVELKAYCPECDSILRTRARVFDSTITECVRCEYKLVADLYSTVYLQKIQLLIVDNIERRNRMNVVVNM